MLDALLVLPILVVLIVAHELGHFVAAKLMKVPVLEFGVGYPPRLFAIRFGGTDYSVNIVPLGGFVRMQGEAGLWDTEGLEGKGPWSRIFIMAAGPAMNLFVAIVIFFGVFMWPRQMAVGDVAVSAVAAGSPAEMAGLQPDDIIVAVNGEAVRDLLGVRQHIYTNLGGEIVMWLRAPDGSERSVAISPRANPPEGEGATGVVLDLRDPQLITVANPPHQAALLALSQTTYVLELTRQALTSIFFRGDVSQVAGPIGIAQFTGEAARSGLGTLIEWMAVLSVNLAIVNILPIPMLDGGRILFIVIEMLRGGRRIPARREGLVHFIGFMILLAFIVTISYNDILRILRLEGLLQ